MLDPYRMVVFNIVLSLVLIIGIILYKVLYPKKKISYSILLFIISLLPLVSLLRKGTYESSALSEYVKIAYNFFLNLETGILLPQWAPFLCAHYGCPDFIYMYPLPFYLVSFFHTFGLSFITSIKLFLAMTFMLSSFAMYYFAKQIVSAKFAFASAILYLFAPYHLVNLHFQVDIAEMNSFVIIPLVFSFTLLFFRTKHLTYLCALVFSIFLLILSHPVISVSTLPLLAIFAILIWKLQKQSIKHFMFYTLGIVFGLLLSTYYWLPAVFESKFIFWGNYATTSTIPLSMMLFSPWRYGLLFQGPTGHLSFFLGFAHWLMIFMSIVYLYIYRNKKNKYILLYFLITFFVIFLGIQELMDPLWKNAPVLKSFQMTYRLLVLIAFITSIIGGIVLSKFNSKYLLVFVCSIAIGTTILNWGNRRTIPSIDDGYLIYELMHKPQPGIDLTAPLWAYKSKSYFRNIRSENIELLKGEAEIKELTYAPTKHIYIVNTQSNLKLKENTFYYPGWNLYINNKKYQFDYDNKDYPGLILFNVKEGIHLVELRFEQTVIRQIGRTISIFTLILLFIFAIIAKLRNYKTI